MAVSLWPTPVGSVDSVLAEIRARARAGALERRGARSQARRVPAERRAYAGDPWAYYADVLGVTLTPQQEAVVEMIGRSTRVLIPSANNVGKTFVVAGYGLYVFDAVAALPDEESGLEEQGARLLLPGPDHDTVFATIYQEMLTLATRAEARGHLMPGERSERSVLWRVRAKWEVEVLTPPKKVGESVAHAASGRHHRNQLALIEEGQGVPDPLWRATEGMCSSEGNTIVSPFNPTEPSGPAHKRATSGSYDVIHLDAFDHPNVRERRAAIPDAVSFRVVDDRVRNDCRERGPFPGTPLDVEEGDFVYALPPKGTPAAEREGARSDGYPGAVGAPLRVYRPNGAFTGQVRGRWPTSGAGGLFDVAALDAAARRWAERPDPAEAPDRVGVDPAREGDDEPVAAPAWGPTAAELLRAYAEAETQGPRALDALKATRRARIGECVVFPNGDGVEVARAVDRRFPHSPLALDEGSVGSSPLDHLARVMGRDAVGVSFSASPQPPVPGEPWCENQRTQLYVRAAMCLARGLVDLPDDELLREELLAHEVAYGSRVVELPAERGPKSRPARKERVASVALVSKDEVKKLIGRSPDRADAFVLALYQAPFVERKSAVTDPRRWHHAGIRA